jgi:uncharacterized protein YggE
MVYMRYFRTQTDIFLYAGIAAGLLATLFFSGLLIGPAANAQEAGLLPPDTNYTDIPRSTIATTGTASQSVQPDKVSVNVGVETNGTTASEAVSRNAEAMEEVISALRNLGIQETELATSSYNVYPIYENVQPTQPCIEIYPPPPECMPKQTIVAYGASNTIAITLDANSTSVDAGEAIDAAVQAGANTVNSVYFFISEELQEEVRSNLIRDAIDNARHRAELAADAVGYTVSGVHSINLNEVNFPVYYGRAASEGGFADAQTALLPGEQQVSTTINVIYYITDILSAQ